MPSPQAKAPLRFCPRPLRRRASCHSPTRVPFTASGASMSPLAPLCDRHQALHAPCSRRLGPSGAPKPSSQSPFSPAGGRQTNDTVWRGPERPQVAAQRGEPWGNSGSHAPHDGLGDELGQGDRARSPEAKEARLPGSGSHSVVSGRNGKLRRLRVPERSCRQLCREYV